MLPYTTFLNISMKNKELDLHGVRHSSAAETVEEFLLTHDLPVSIITGNSIAMKNIVKDILEKKKLNAYYLNPNNLGKLFVCKDKID